MSELEVVLECLRAAKAANVASFQALEAVERMLGGLQTSETTAEVPAEEVLESEPVGCQHADAIKVTTVHGTVLVCECGWNGEQKI